jgi:hypothetical protein
MGNEVADIFVLKSLRSIIEAGGVDVCELPPVISAILENLNSLSTVVCLPTFSF